MASTATTLDTATQTTTTNRLGAALTIAAICIVVVWVAVTALVLALSDTTTLGAIGVGAFGGFWLGGGFGVIFGSAAAFGKDH